MCICKKPVAVPCHVRADIGFVLDVSGSIGETEFKKGKELMEVMADSFGAFSKSGTRVGVVTFSGGAEVSLIYVL